MLGGYLTEMRWWRTWRKMNDTLRDKTRVELAVKVLREMMRGLKNKRS